jgi:hypothetical protein
MKRNSAQTIFRTVVFAGAMLGAPACKKNPPAATTPPTNTQTAPATTETGTAPMTTEKPAGDEHADPCADPCAGGERPRGVDDDGGGGEGRGFILS